VNAKEFEILMGSRLGFPTVFEFDIRFLSAQEFLEFRKCFLKSSNIPVALKAQKIYQSFLLSSPRNTNLASKSNYKLPIEASHSVSKYK